MTQPDDYDDVREFDQMSDRNTAGMTEDEQRDYAAHMRDTFEFQLWPDAKRMAAAANWMDPHDALRTMMAALTAFALDETQSE